MKANLKSYSSPNLYVEYTNEIHKIPMLSRSEELECAQKAKIGDPVARDTLVQANLRFVVSVANKYKSSGLSQMDLINEGNVGLIKAAERFDPEMGFHFISYAVWWIKQAILFAIQQKAHPIRIPLNRSAELRRLKSAETWLNNNGDGKEASIFDLSEIACVNPDEALHLLNISKEQISLDAPIANNEDGSLIDKIEDQSNTFRNESYFHKDLQTEIHDLLDILTKKEQNIIILRYGLFMQEPQSLQKIGNKMHLSKERIRQIEKKALLKLRNNKLANQLKAYLQN